MNPNYEKYLKLKKYIDSKSIYLDCSPNYNKRSIFEEYIEYTINNSMIIKYINDDILSTNNARHDLEFSDL